MSASQMAITYYKRLRMEMNLDGLTDPPPPLPAPYFWIPWDEGLLAVHAEIKYQSFREAIDAAVFPCLGDRNGCLRLMREIRRKAGFLPAATWLIGHPDGCVGTIQGVIDRGPIGAIQNVGVLPEHRGRGLGGALVLHALAGFRQGGARQAYLEVTAENRSAVHLYRGLGFHRVKTLYKAVSA